MKTTNLKEEIETLLVNLLLDYIKTAKLNITEEQSDALIEQTTQSLLNLFQQYENEARIDEWEKMFNYQISVQWEDSPKLVSLSRREIFARIQTLNNIRSSYDKSI